jgi:hypothetical protein
VREVRAALRERRNSRLVREVRIAHGEAFTSRASSRERDATPKAGTAFGAIGDHQ